MTSITSYAIIPGGTHILGCGHGYVSLASITDLSAAFFSISNDGHLQYFYGIASGPTTGVANRCYGIAFDKDTNLVYIFLQTKSTTFSLGTNTDNAIVVIDELGNV